MHLALRLYLVYRIDPFLTITELYKVSTMTLLQMCVDFLDSAPLWHFDQFFHPFMVTLTNRFLIILF